MPKSFLSIMKQVLNTKKDIPVVEEPTITEKFLAKYDPNKNYKFDGCRFRPGAPFTTDFGLDNTFKVLRLHPAIDRGYSSTSIYDIYAPFDIEGASFIHPYSSFGSLLFLPVKDADFEIRIAHIIPEEISPYFERVRKEKVDMPKNNKIAEAGNLGISSGTEIVKGKAGAHTHTEIVSNSYTSIILEDILNAKISSSILEKPYSEADVVKYAESVNAYPSDFLTQYYAEILKRKITFINNYKCIRTDYYTGETKTFYNSRVLFEL